MAAECTHLDQIKITTTDKHVCEDCIKTGDTWVHLRLCVECGHVGCCDSSKNKHATKHFRKTRHPICAPTKEARIGDGATWTRSCLSRSRERGELAHSRALPLGGNSCGRHLL